MNDPKWIKADDPIVIYSNGLCYCSVCAPSDYTEEMLEEEVNMIHPTGMDGKWSVSKDKFFSTGQTNPCQCHDTDERRHWLMSC
jgi:hypothetical protein